MLNDLQIRALKPSEKPFPPRVPDRQEKTLTIGLYPEIGNACVLTCTAHYVDALTGLDLLAVLRRIESRGTHELAHCLFHLQPRYSICKSNGYTGEPLIRL